VPERTGILVLRVWGNAKDGLRARITQVTDVHDTSEIITTAKSPEEIHAAVATWLQGFLVSDS
jgi:hypothetical protein